MKVLRNIAALAAACALAFSCDFFDVQEPDTYDDVLILYSAGFNDLYSYLLGDIDEMEGGDFIPWEHSSKALVVITHQVWRSIAYKYPRPPYVIRIYRDKEARVIRDTVMTFDESCLMTDPDFLTESLNYVKDNFKSKSYGMIASSHGSGWVPSGYYINPKKFDSTVSSELQNVLPEYVGAASLNDEPAVKSFGRETQGPMNNLTYYEMDITDMAKAIPMHLDFLLFDACLMGSVEVAYEFKDVADCIGFSQTEVLADGLDYHTIAGHLVGSPEHKVVDVCRSYYEQYDKKEGTSRSATISCVDCAKLATLENVCKTLFSRYSAELRSLDYSQVQGFFRSDRHFYFDLVDIFAKIGVTSEELSQLNSAIEECILYKAATPGFMYPGSGFAIDAFCGLSMYLPSAGSLYLDNFYKTLAWNEAASLVQ